MNVLHCRGTLIFPTIFIVAACSTASQNVFSSNSEAQFGLLDALAKRMTPVSANVVGRTKFFRMLRTRTF